MILHWVQWGEHWMRRIKKAENSRRNWSREFRSLKGCKQTWKVCTINHKYEAFFIWKYLRNWKRIRWVIYELSAVFQNKIGLALWTNEYILVGLIETKILQWQILWVPVQRGLSQRLGVARRSFLAVHLNFFLIFIICCAILKACLSFYNLQVGFGNTKILFWQPVSQFLINPIAR